MLERIFIISMLLPLLSHPGRCCNSCDPPNLRRNSPSRRRLLPLCLTFNSISAHLALGQLSPSGSTSFMSSLWSNLSLPHLLTDPHEPPSFLDGSKRLAPLTACKTNPVTYFDHRPRRIIVCIFYFSHCVVRFQSILIILLALHGNFCCQAMRQTPMHLSGRPYRCGRGCFVVDDVVRDLCRRAQTK